MGCTPAMRDETVIARFLLAVQHCRAPIHHRAVIARLFLDRAIQYPRVPMIDCEALQYWATRSPGRRAAPTGGGW
jgi:hypothetical protein